MLLTIIIPVFNEEKTVLNIIKKVKSAKLPKGISREILVVDDGSTDGTKKIIKSIPKIKILTHKKNLGKGAAVVTGIKNANGEIILIQDADLEYDPKYFNRLIEPIVSGKSKVVYGSRFLNYPLILSGKNKTPLILHYLGNKFLTLITNLLYGNSVTDMETCYKVFSSDVIKKIKLNSKKFDIEPEITAKLLKKHIRIYEVPIKVNPRGYEEGKKITWKDGFYALKTLIRYRFAD